jgi:hypothetical protein
MKKKIRIVDKTTGKVLEREYTVRNLFHFNVQLNSRMQVQESKKHKKPKYKHKIYEED